MMRTAEDYVAQRDFANTEKVYRDLLAIDPSNADAIKGLATALYREDKIEESAEVLDRLPNNFGSWCASEAWGELIMSGLSGFCGRPVTLALAVMAEVRFRLLWL